jgi:hypothetical protein
MLEKFNMTLTLLIVAGLGVGGYLIYDWLQNGDSGPTDDVGQTASLLGALRGTNSIDPATGQSNGLVNSINNFVFNEKFPGGGEAAGTSETYTGAASEVLAHPLGSLWSILGGN